MGWPKPRSAVVDAGDVGDPGQFSADRVQYRHAALIEETDLVGSKALWITGVIEKSRFREHARGDDTTVRERDHAKAPDIALPPDREQTRAVGQAETERWPVDAVIQSDDPFEKALVGQRLGCRDGRQGQHSADGQRTPDPAGQTDTHKNHYAVSRLARRAEKSDRTARPLTAGHAASFPLREAHLAPRPARAGARRCRSRRRPISGSFDYLVVFIFSVCAGSRLSIMSRQPTATLVP